MIRGLFVAALTGCVAVPAMAGDKPKLKPTPALRARVLATSEHAAAQSLPGRVPARATHTTFVLPPAPGGLERVVSAKRKLVVDPAQRDRAVALDQLNASSLWNTGAPVSEITGEAGGSYAVRDYFAAQRKPRQRQTPLGAMFVLRLDGQEESPSFSVGGGGVPAALWGVMPKN